MGRALRPQPGHGALTLGEVVAKPLEPLVDVVHPVAAQRRVEAHGIHVDGLRALGKARVRGGVDGLGQRVRGQPAARHAEHRRDERDGDEHEDDVRDHALLLNPPEMLAEPSVPNLHLVAHDEAAGSAHSVVHGS